MSCAAGSFFAALAMAILWRGMTPAETAALPAPLREVVAAARRDAAGMVTDAALRNEVRRRAITDGDGGAHQLEIAGR